MANEAAKKPKVRFTKYKEEQYLLYSRDLVDKYNEYCLVRKSALVALDCNIEPSL